MMSHAPLPTSPPASLPAPLSDAEQQAMDAYWRAANYLSVGQIYLRDNPLLREPLRREHVKRMLLGHWGTTPGQNFIYVHLNRVIVRDDLDMIYIAGPGHGGPAAVAQTYLEGTYSEVYPHVTQDEAGLRKLFAQFSFPGGIGSHVTPECPGSIHEGSELGYSLSHAFGAVLDNPTLIAACVIGDGEAETGPLATAWHSNKFLDPLHDGTVLPILHLNGYKIASPTILARIPHDELVQFMSGCGWWPLLVEGEEPAAMHQAMAHALDQALEAIATIRRDANGSGDGTARAPRWPMIVLRSPKGWTGPERVDGLPNTGTFRAHQVPIVLPPGHDGESHLRQLEAWLASYRPAELFDANGRLRSALAALAPTGVRRMGANPHANGGALLRDLELPDFRRYAQRVDERGTHGPGDTRVLAPWLGAVVRENAPRRNLRVFGPDETVSNGLGALFADTARQWAAQILPDDDALARDGRVLEVLSEHQCQGWLEGYLLTGRHGVFNCYEAFVHIVDSMFNQHAKWLDASAKLPWRRPIASLNYLLSSHVWRQDHNGFTHQDPGFIDVVANKKASVVRVYLPPDANCLLAVMDRCLRSRHGVNVVVAGKHPSPQWLSIDEAVQHCAAGISEWAWAGSGTDAVGEPDLVMACAGDVPTQETLAAVMLLREGLPGLRVRVVNVVDLLKLQPPSQHPQGLPDDAFDALFTRNRPVLFAYHGYPTLIHRLSYRRTNHHNFHVHGYREEGTVTTPFDMTVLNELDRFHLAISAVDLLPEAGAAGAMLVAKLQARLSEHHRYIRHEGQDLDEIRGWRWSTPSDGGRHAAAPSSYAAPMRHARR
jgi:xylulose-5-phosphate/fructose-6-phosphate phosphoketolase